MLSTSDATIIDGIPITTPTRTLIDLASVAAPELVEEALDDALRRGMVSIPGLRRRFKVLARPGKRGVASLRRLLDARDPASVVPESVFERRLLRLIERAGLPPPALQHPIRTHNGRLVAFVDFAYVDVRLAIEADGYRWHSGRARWDRDRERGNRLTLLGWRVMHITWPELTRTPHAVTEAIRHALSIRR